MRRKEHKFIDGIEVRYCIGCDDWLILRSFTQDFRMLDGLSSLCRKCGKERREKYRSLRPEKYTETRQRYKKENPEKIKQTQKKYYKKNVVKAKAVRKQWKAANKKKIKASGQKRYIKNREKINQQNKDWRKAHPEKMAEYFAKYLSTIKGALSHRILCLLRQSLKNGKNGRHWRDILGYTYDQLKKHLEKTMPKGYTWNDLDKLHIDHIVPISVHNFEKVTDEDFKKCWALKNLQLLPAFKNISKGAKLNKHFQPSLIFGDTGG